MTNGSDYTVTVGFEALGDWGVKAYPTLAEAETAAEALRSEVARMVEGWEVPEYGSELTGWASEIAAWREAAVISEGSTRYTREAAEMIAERAVEIEKAMAPAETPAT